MLYWDDDGDVNDDKDDGGGCTDYNDENAHDDNDDQSGDNDGYGGEDDKIDRNDDDVKTTMMTMTMIGEMEVIYDYNEATAAADGN